jgi:hypothetical protein
MFASHQKSDRDYTPAIALVAVAFIWNQLLVVSRPFGYWPVLSAMACSVISVTWAWVDWMSYARTFGDRPSFSAFGGTQYAQVK